MQSHTVTSLEGNASVDMPRHVSQVSCWTQQANGVGKAIGINADMCIPVMLPHMHIMAGFCVNICVGECEQSLPVLTHSYSTVRVQPVYIVAHGKGPSRRQTLAHGQLQHKYNVGSGVHGGS